MQKSTDKAKLAAALRYDSGRDDVPVLTAFGQGNVAERIIEKAQEFGVPIVEDQSLASVLQQVSVGDEIPQELYEVVAQVLIFVGAAEIRSQK